MVRLVGRYELGKTLGKGTFSKVKIGYDRKGGGEVAVKVIHKERMTQEELQDQVLREISVTKLLRHENIVRVQEVFQTQKYVYLVMELVDGGMLYTKLVGAGRFLEDETRRYFQQLILGVRYCHNQEIAHRDLKLENLLLGKDGVLKISDFGLANLQSKNVEAEGDSALLRTVCGTPNYVAPEVLNADHRGYDGMVADIWSCGILLYVMLAGMLPFEHGDVDVLFKLIETCDYTVPRWFSEEAVDLLSLILVKDPSRRATLDTVISHPWFQKDFDPTRLDATTQPIIKGDDPIETVDELESSGYSSTLAGSPLARSAPTSPFDRRSPPPKTLMGSMILDTPVDVTLVKLAEALTELDAHPDKRPGSLELKGYTTRCRHGKMLAYSVVCLETATEKSVLEVRFVRGAPQDFDDFFLTLRSRMEEGLLAQ